MTGGWQPQRANEEYGEGLSQTSPTRQGCRVSTRNPLTGKTQGKSNSMVINTNIAAQTGARLLGESTTALNKSLARLSSGLKIVSPEDDAAGLAVSSRFDAQINRVNAVNTNVSNAISFSQTQDGYLKKIAKALDRMSELSVMSQDKKEAANVPVIFNLGNNNALTREQTVAIFEAVKDQPRIIVVNTAVPRPWREGNNSLIAEVASKYANVIIVDWNAISEGRPEYFAPDGVHLVPTGVDVYVAEILKHLD